MQNFFAKIVAVAMLVGGFFVTGDLGWIAEKGQRIVGAADVPAGFEVVTVPSPPSPPPAVAQAQPEVASPSPAAVESVPDAPIEREPSGPEPVGGSFRPPAGGLSEVAWATLGTGSRIVVWIAGPPYRCLVLDFVDPSTGEALLYDVATVDELGKPLTTAGPPRRVIVGRDDAGRPRGTGLVRGGSIHIAQTGIAPHASGQWLGPVAAITRGN
jgi:hypothetical protein